MKKDLMIPRVIVTNWYPGCPFKVGDILHLDYVDYFNDEPTKDSGLPVYFLDGDTAKRSVIGPDVDKAPANFRILQWWEHRAESDLPQYVKVAEHVAFGDGSKFKKNGVWKVEKTEVVKSETYVRIAGNYAFTWDELLPTTLEEYEQYQSSKTEE